MIVLYIFLGLVAILAVIGVGFLIHDMQYYSNKDKDIK